eukprot:1161470-Pelagomonas_calceolata.AAC.12
MISPHPPAVHVACCGLLSLMSGQIRAPLTLSGWILASFGRILAPLMLPGSAPASPRTQPASAQHAPGQGEHADRRIFGPRGWRGAARICRNVFMQWGVHPKSASVSVMDHIELEKAQESRSKHWRVVVVVLAPYYIELATTCQLGKEWPWRFAFPPYTEFTLFLKLFLGCGCGHWCGHLRFVEHLSGTTNLPGGVTNKEGAKRSPRMGCGFPQPGVWGGSTRQAVFSPTWRGPSRITTARDRRTSQEWQLLLPLPLLMGSTLLLDAWLGTLPAILGLERKRQGPSDCCSVCKGEEQIGEVVVRVLSQGNGTAGAKSETSVQKAKSKSNELRAGLACGLEHVQG